MLFVPTVSWLWWNVFGFFVTVVSGYLVSLSTRTWADVSGLVWSRRAFEQAKVNSSGGPDMAYLLSGLL